MHIPEPIVDRSDGTNPEHEALLADSVGLALLVVLETLSPPERLAFVLHDIFAMPFDEIAPIVERSPEATRQLASRARRRIQAESIVPDADLDTQREVLDAFLAASREGDFDRLVAVLDPDVVLKVDFGPEGGSQELRGRRRSPARRRCTEGSARNAAGHRQRDSRSRLVPRRTVVLDRCHHGPRPKDRRDGHPRRPGAAPRARPVHPRRLGLPWPQNDKRPARGGPPARHQSRSRSGGGEICSEGSRVAATLARATMRRTSIVPIWGQVARLSPLRTPVVPGHVVREGLIESRPLACVSCPHTWNLASRT